VGSESSLFLFTPNIFKCKMKFYRVVARIRTICLHQIVKVSRVIHSVVIKQQPRSYREEPPLVPTETES